MYKLMIVDDEEWIRERLTKTVSWDRIGVEVAGEAQDADEAFALTQTLCPDIVLTDIRMPGMSGLEFVEKLHALGLPLRIIIISGYDDFKYAQRAIQLGADDYLLKPIEDEELLDAVSACVKRISEVRQHQNEYSTLLNKALYSVSAAREKLLMGLLTGSYQDGDSLCKELAKIGEDAYIDRKEDFVWHVCLILEIDNFDDVQVNDYWNKPLLSFAVTNITKDYFSPLGDWEILSQRADHLVCVISSTQKEKNKFCDALTDAVREIQKTVLHILEKTVSAGIGSICESFWDISASYSGAEQALNCKSYFGKGRLYRVDDLITTVQYELLDFPMTNALKQAVHAWDLPAAKTVICSLVSRSNRQSVLEQKQLFLTLAFMFLQTTVPLGLAEDDVEIFRLFVFDHLQHLQNSQQLCDWLCEGIELLLNSSGKSAGKNKRKIVCAALEYLEKNYKNKLSLNDVANELHLNPSYFCKLFKESTGESFTRYLQKLRVRKAQLLLSNPTYKIYEVGSMVGYEDSQYFNKIFKSIAGKTPMQYREKM